MTRIEFNPEDCDLYSNFMPISHLKSPSLDILPENYKNAFKNLFEKIISEVQQRSKDGNIINTPFKTALYQNMEDLVFKIQWEQQPLAGDIMKYLSDKLARTTKYVLMITHRNVDEAKTILASLDPVINTIFGENVDSMVNYISSYYANRKLELDIC